MDEQMKVIKSDSRSDAVYANGVNINFSIFEARLEFLRDTPDAIAKQIYQETMADIRMSPQLAKATALFLLQQVNSYEKQFGEISLPNDQQGDVNE